jgi:hypothetical protein
MAIEGKRQAILSSSYFVFYPTQEDFGLSWPNALLIFSVPQYAADILGKRGSYMLFRQGSAPPHFYSVWLSVSVNTGLCLTVWSIYSKRTYRRTALKQSILYVILEGRSLKTEHLKRTFKRSCSSLRAAGTQPPRNFEKNYTKYQNISFC